MRFILGGYAQGKCAYVKEKYAITDDEICDGAIEDFAKSTAPNWSCCK